MCVIKERDMKRRAVDEPANAAPSLQALHTFRQSMHRVDAEDYVFEPSRAASYAPEFARAILVFRPQMRELLQSGRAQPLTLQELRREAERGTDALKHALHTIQRYITYGSVRYGGRFRRRVR